MTHEPKEYRIENGYPGLYNVCEYDGDNLLDVIMRDVTLDRARFFQAAPDLLAACEAALLYLEAVADRIDEQCGEAGCTCTMPSATPCSQSLRENEIAQCKAAIARVAGEE